MLKNTTAGHCLVSRSGAFWDSAFFFCLTKHVASLGPRVFVGCHTTKRVPYQMTALMPQSEYAGSVQCFPGKL